MAEAKTYTLKITSAVAIDGVIRKAGSLVDVEEFVAKNLLHRGKAVVATAEDQPAQKVAEVEVEAEPAKPAAKASTKK